MLRKLLLDKHLHVGDVLGLKCFSKYKAVICINLNLMSFVYSRLVYRFYPEANDCWISLLQREIRIYE
jgi:hypothetical protein